MIHYVLLTVSALNVLGAVINYGKEGSFGWASAFFGWTTACLAMLASM